MEVPAPISKGVPFTPILPTRDHGISPGAANEFPIPVCAAMVVAGSPAGVSWPPGAPTKTWPDAEKET